MYRLFHPWPAILAIALSIPFSGFSCGYDFIGGCSSGVSLSINGTSDSFNLSACSAGLSFDGLHLGSLNSLHLTGARAVTWESCTNNVVGVDLLYRIYPEGQAGGAWQTLALDVYAVTEEGPYTTRYRRTETDVDVCNGLTLGTNYVVEVYLRAAVDTVGDDLIPETTLLKNNGGQNFKMFLRYDGPDAPPFVLLKVLMQEPLCAGDSTGTVGIHVYGEQNVFYSWSGPDANFWAIDSLSAGWYAVTVTGTDGYQSSDTFLLTAPDPITVLLNTVPASSPVSADGSMEAIVGGGTPPYSFGWSQGDTSSLLIGLLPGEYCVQVSDARGCTQWMCGNVGYATKITYLESLAALRAFPNPVALGQNISISFSVNCDQIDNRFQYTWINSNGTSTLKQHIEAVSTLLTIPTTHLSKGLWLLRLEANTSVVFIPVVVF